MNKICGYSCEHNKSGVCQISVCDKKLIMSDKTEVQTFTRYIDTTITKLQQENKKLNGAIQTYDILLKSNVEENKKLKDNWNRLREWTKKAVDKYYDCDLRVEMVYKNVLNKMQELEGSD